MTIKHKIMGIGFTVVVSLGMICGSLGFLNHSLENTLNTYRGQAEQLQGLLQLNTSVVGLTETCNHAIVQTIMGEDTEAISAALSQKIADHDRIRSQFNFTGSEEAQILDLDHQLKTKLDHISELILAGDSYGAGEEISGIKAVSQQVFALSETLEASLVREYQDSLRAQERNRMILFVSIGFVMVILGFLFVLTAKSIIGVNADFSIKLADSSETVNSASSQVSDFSRSSAERASLQAASIEETSASLEVISAMTRRNAENAGKADTLMGDASRVIAQANATMEELTQAMADIYTASADTSRIVNTIDEIAFQTNLLALNAAVEAARAGDAGKGFAVVAEEVRNLAKRAAEAAQNTTGLIAETVRKVDDGKKLVASTNSAFAEVSASSHEVGDLVSQIATVSQEQAEGIEQVNASVGEMDRVVQQNAANAEESASVSQEMNAQAEQMKQYVDSYVALIGCDMGGVK